MPWLKKNLVLVVGAAVALVLLGVAGYYLYTRISLESEVSAALEAQTAELDRLSRLDPHPGTEKVNNIDAAVKQEQQLQGLLGEVQKTFVPVAYPKGLESGQFKLLLDNTVDELQRAAERAGVRLQPNYAFTFSAQKPLMSFDRPSIEPMTQMLMDIRAVSLALFQAKILALDGVRRPSVGALETPSLTPGVSDYWSKKPTTNTLAVLTPYEFTFHCFTPELAKVAAGLAHSVHSFLVKSVVVDTTISTLLDKSAADGYPGAEMGAMPMTPTMPQGMNPMMLQMMRRYGMGGMGGAYSRYFPRGGEGVEPLPTAPTGPIRPGTSVVLDERPFRVVLWVDSVRLREPEEPKAPRGRARPGMPAGEPMPGGMGEGAPAADPSL
ncbi:MAG: hypothetical protein FJ387_00015 [Verrucomicrobia bacterium]|nr:hypothetical protein [Verrucomicrobiota bacterium]